MTKRIIYIFILSSSLLFLTGCDLIWALLGEYIYESRHDSPQTEEVVDPVEELYSQGVERMNRGDYSGASKYFQIATNRGHLGAQYRLGTFYFYGRGVERNYNTAVNLLQKPANSGYSEAEYLLGVCYCNGYGVPVNKSKAATLLSEAAQRGSFEAKEFLRENF